MPDWRRDGARKQMAADRRRDITRDARDGELAKVAHHRNDGDSDEGVLARLRTWASQILHR